MEYSFSSELKDRYVHVRVKGDNSPATVKRYLDEVLQTCRELDCPNVLIEENLEGPRLDALHIFTIIREKGKEAAGRLERIAYVDANSKTGPGMIHLTEALAMDRGLKICAFYSVREAEEWMLSETAPAS